MFLVALSSCLVSLYCLNDSDIFIYLKPTYVLFVPILRTTCQFLSVTKRFQLRFEHSMMDKAWVHLNMY